MNVMRRGSAPRYKRDNIVSYLLVSELTGNSRNLIITLVEMEPGGVQHVHVTSTFVLLVEPDTICSSR